jgi:hypothetical protein
MKRFPSPTPLAGLPVSKKINDQDSEVPILAVAESTTQAPAVEPPASFTPETDAQKIARIELALAHQTTLAQRDKASKEYDDGGAVMA